MAAEHGVPVIEGAGAAVKLAETLVGLRLLTSKTGGWATPTAKPYKGTLAAFDGIGARA
jgi:allantoin racemase